jgi:MOSC domain-containing protein YiiM
MKMITEGKVLELFITKNDVNKTRESVTSINVDKAGIVGDKFYNKNIKRSILLTSKESYILSSKNNIDISYGSLGENILMDINPYALSTGDKLIIGETELEITQIINT